MGISTRVQGRAIAALQNEGKRDGDERAHVRMRRNHRNPAPHSRRTCCPGSTRFAKAHTGQRRADSSIAPFRWSVESRQVTGESEGGRPKSAALQIRYSRPAAQHWHRFEEVALGMQFRSGSRAGACAMRHASRSFPTRGWQEPGPRDVGSELIGAPGQGVEHLPVNQGGPPRRRDQVIFLCRVPRLEVVRAPRPELAMRAPPPPPDVADVAPTGLSTGPAVPQHSEAKVPGTDSQRR